MIQELKDTGTSKSVKEIFSIQKEYFPVLKSEPLEMREKRLLKLQDWILKNLDKIHEAVYSDMHKPRTESDISEAYVVVSEIRYALKNLGSWTRAHKVKTPLALIPARGWIKFEPKGVCLIISPWNFPFNLAIVPLVNALAAGNAVIIKPSELAPATSALIKQMVSELYQPHEVAVVEGDADAAQELLSLPFNHVFFTGSQRIGRKILEAVSPNLTPVTLELGGKSPVVIDASANLSDAAEKIIVGKFFNSGQTCIAPDYCLVEESIFSKFALELRNALGKRYGTPEVIRKSKDYSRLVNRNHFNKMVAMLNDAVEKGAKVETGGKHDLAELYFEPTILSETSLEMTVENEEIFGPILPLKPYAKLEDAIDIVNGMASPLVIYYFSNSSTGFEKLSRSTTSGAISWNDVAFYFTHTGLPFGGINESGTGRSHGFAGFKTFSNERSIIKQRSGWIPAKLVFPPFDKISRRITKIMLKYL